MDAYIHSGKDIGKIVRKLVKRWLFLTINLRIHRNIRKQRKIGHKTRFIYFGRATRAIHELILCVICCLCIGLQGK